MKFIDGILAATIGYILIPFIVILFLCLIIPGEIEGIRKYGWGNYRNTAKGVIPTREWKDKNPYH